MTKPRNDEHGTEFGLWLRGQLPNQVTDVHLIDSSLGYVATNIDYKWENYKTGDWMFVEEKRFRGRPRWSQQKQFQHLDAVCRMDPKYHGLHVLRFEYTNPDDGQMWLDDLLITQEQLLAFLRFEN